MKRSRLFKRSHSLCNYSDVVECDSDRNCIWDSVSNRCNRKRSPVLGDILLQLEEKDSYLDIPTFPVELSKLVHSYYNDNSLIGNYPSNPLKIFKLLQRASIGEIQEFIKFLPDYEGDEWFMREVFDIIDGRVTNAMLRDIIIPTQHPFFNDLLHEKLKSDIRRKRMISRR